MKLSDLTRKVDVYSIDEAAPTHDYVPSKEELEKEISDTKEALQMYKHQNRGPMVTKMSERLKTLEKKKAKLNS